MRMQNLLKDRVLILSIAYALISLLTVVYLFVTRVEVVTFQRVVFTLWFIMLLLVVFNLLDASQRRRERIAEQIRAIKERAAKANSGGSENESPGSEHTGAPDEGMLDPKSDEAISQQHDTLAAVQEYLRLLATPSLQDMLSPRLTVHYADRWASWKPQEALSTCNGLLTVSRKLGNQQAEWVALHNLGAIWDELREPQKALPFYEEALRLSRAVGDARCEAVTLTHLGKIWGELGEPGKARDFQQRSQALQTAIHWYYNDTSSMKR